MVLKKIYFLIYLLINFSFPLIATEGASLKPSDVSKVMDQIFAQHVAEKGITPLILNNALRNYIDQFDPHRLYLLKQEVHPFIHLPALQLEAIIQQYRQNDFSMFSKLNDVIQKAIRRERRLRQQLMENKEALFDSHRPELDSEKEEWQDPDLKTPFAKDQDELKERIKQRFLFFIDAEKKHFGKTVVMRHQDKTLKIYERYLRGQENHYLYEDEENKPLNPAQQENLFILHVLKALTSSLDAHTTFYDNAEAYDMKVRLEKAFEGIGVILQQNGEGSVIISQVLKGGPADKNGTLRVGDRVLSVNQQPVQDQPLEKIMDMMRGESGSMLTLVIEHKKEKNQVKADPVTLTLKREPIAVDEDRVDIGYEKFGEGIIGKITLHSFYQGENGVSSENDVREAILALSKIGRLEGLILDLRENSGGFLTQAVKVAGLFITNGVVVISKYSTGTEHFYRDMDGNMAYHGPLIILTSKATASAAEIVAQALQDYGVALIVGDERTYGKGTIQSQTVTDNKALSYFKVTIGKYYTVSGKTPQINGVKADILVPGPLSAEHIGEQYLENAISADTITAEYQDDLQDVDTGLKAWYMRYYIPTIQHQLNDWRGLLPKLRENSTARLAHNSNYQTFLRHLKGERKEEETHLDLDGKSMQMTEAVHIIKDMIDLQSTLHHSSTESKLSSSKSKES